MKKTSSLLLKAARQQDEKRRERALLLRYPDRKAHERERDLALAVVDDIIASSQKRTQALMEERVAINTEMEFYLKDPSRAPFALKSRLESNISNQKAQQQFVISQGVEKARLNSTLTIIMHTTRLMVITTGPLDLLIKAFAIITTMF